MKKSVSALVAVVMLAALSGAPARTAHGSQVIVSSTLNDTLLFFDASTLEETQPPLVSKGLAPVRLAVETIGARTYLFSANHGIAGSLGVFDLSGDLVVELPLSPFPTGALGSVGVAVGSTTAPPLQQRVAYVVVTNAHQALAGCGVPKGSATIFDASLLDIAGAVIPAGSIELAGAQPFAVGTDGGTSVYVSSNCADRVESFTARNADPPSRGLMLERTATGVTGAGPDGIAVDTDRVYVANIGGSSVSVFDGRLSGGVARTTVGVGRGPIEVARADSLSGRRWMITGNGGEGSISIIDRALVDACIEAAQATCSATVATIPTGVPGGAPESVAYDAASNRVFVVNKTFPPSLSVIQLVEGPGGSVTGSEIGPIALGALGSATAVPSVIAFDVVVRSR